MPSVVEEWYWDFGNQFLTKWKIEGKEYKNEALQYFYTMGIGSLQGTILYNYSFNKDFVAQKYTKASECPHWAKESIEWYRQSAEGFVKDLLCIQKSPRKITVGDVYVELNSALKPTDQHGLSGSLYSVKNLSDYNILKIIFVRNNSLGVKPTYLRIVQDNTKKEMIITTPEMKRNPVSADTETGLKRRHFKVPNAFFRDRAIHDYRIEQGEETEQEVLDEFDKQISLLNQFMKKVNSQFYDTIREQLNIKYVDEEKPVDVRLQMARRRLGLEAEGITTTPLLWAGATVLTLLTLFKHS